MQRNFEIYANEIEWRKASDLASQEISPVNNFKQ